MKSFRTFFGATILVLATFLGLNGCATSPGAKKSLSESLTLFATFDHGLDADYARGDKTLFGAVDRSKPQSASPGLPENQPISLAKGEGRFGDALRFSKKSNAIVFYKGEKNFDYRRTNWSGSISFWLKLDPDKDLEPGYCDPVQMVAGNWNNGVFFAEFSKDDPRRFRFALRPLAHIWNPKKIGWEAIPAAERPMVEISQPPFGSDRWTHVAFTFANANTGRTNGVGRLFLNGNFAGEFNNWDLAVNWKPEDILVNLGVLYVGLLDEVALFDRALNQREIKSLFEQPEGLHRMFR